MFRIAFSRESSLICENAEHDFGRVAPNDVLTNRFVIENRDNRPVKILKVIPGCGSCVEVLDYSLDPIQPGDNGYVVLKLLPEHLSGEVVKTAVLKFDDPLLPIITLKMKAEIISKIREE